MGKTVLVLEDDEGVRRFLKVILKSEGIELVETWTVPDAIRECAAQRFDTLILDYNLADGDVGWRLAQEIRGDPARYGSPRIIAASGTVQLDAVESLGFKKSNFDAFLQKPFDLAELLEQLHKPASED